MISEAVKVFSRHRRVIKVSEILEGLILRISGGSADTKSAIISVVSSALEPKIALLGLFSAIRFPCENTTVTSPHDSHEASPATSFTGPTRGFTGLWQKRCCLSVALTHRSAVARVSYIHEFPSYRCN